jgi:hypothetical protein
MILSIKSISLKRSVRIVISLVLVGFVGAAVAVGSPPISTAQAQAQPQNAIRFSSTNVVRAVQLYKELGRITNAPAPGTVAGTVECGYKGSAFGCTGTGLDVIKDIAAACKGGGQLGCTGSGNDRTCTCIFN